MQGIYWLAENRLASQEGLCCVEWVSGKLSLKVTFRKCNWLEMLTGVMWLKILTNSRLFFIKVMNIRFLQKAGIFLAYPPSLQAELLLKKIGQQDATTFSFLNLFNSALHVSGDKFAHPQEHFLTVYTALGTMHSNDELYINKIQQDATVCRYLFTAKLLCMFRASIAPIIRSTSNCNCSFWYRS